MEESMEQRIVVAMQRVWGAIAADILAGDNPEELSVTITRNQVIEVVVDADRLLTLGEDAKAAKVYYSLGRCQKNTMGKKAFPHQRYGG